MVKDQGKESRSQRPRQGKESRDQGPRQGKDFIYKDQAKDKEYRQNA